MKAIALMILGLLLAISFAVGFECERLLTHRDRALANEVRAIAASPPSITVH